MSSIGPLRLFTAGFRLLEAFRMSRDMTIFSRIVIAAAFSLFLLEGAIGSSFSARLIDNEWDGKTVPLEHVCKLGGASNPMSPRIEVEGIPEGTIEIVIEFNDESYPKLAKDGGHGKIAIVVPKNSSSVIVPSVPSESTDVPKGVSVVAKHRSTTPGYYLAPCSRGQSHVYSADVVAQKKVWFFFKKELARTRVELGKY